MELSFREVIAKEFMEHKFVPAIHKMLEEANPKEYKKWGGNACRQTAVFGYLYLKTLLPEYKWTAWDGVFNDIVNGKPVVYNHAWLYGVNKDTGDRLLVDAARQHHERLFMHVTGNRYPKDHPSYKDMKEIERTKLNVEEMLKDEEYYTSLPANEFLSKLESTMNSIKS